MVAPIKSSQTLQRRSPVLGRAATTEEKSKACPCDDHLELRQIAFGQTDLFASVCCFPCPDSARSASVLNNMVLIIC